MAVLQKKCSQGSPIGLHVHPSTPFHISFDHVISNDAFFIDKSLFIKDFIENGSDTSLFLRPRRFGKSTNITMLRSFLSREAKAGDFSRFAISNDADFMDKHCGKYSVVHLDLKDVKGRTWEAMQIELWSSVQDMYGRHCEELPELFSDFTQLKRDKFPIPANLSRYLAKLIAILADIYKHEQRKIILLIDEFDTPLNHAFKNGFYDEASSFFEIFYSRALKGNKDLAKACLMGIVEIRGKGMLSGLNNLAVYSVADERFSQYFGFTSDEIAPIAGPYMANILHWYDGYKIGNFNLINPYSFVRWLEFGKLDLFWVGSANIESLRDELVENLDLVLKTTINLCYVYGYKIFVPKLSPVINYGTMMSEFRFWFFLVHAGYLTYEPDLSNPEYGHVSIPNSELRRHWQDTMSETLAMKFSPSLKKLELIKALEKFEIKPLQDFLEDLITTPSYHGRISENSYHVLFLGLLLGIIRTAGNRTTIISSNEESGDGRYDVAMEFRSLKRVIIIEIKKSENKELLDIDLQIAINQIVDKSYEADFPGMQVLLIGVSFFEKRVSYLEHLVVET